MLTFFIVFLMGVFIGWLLGNRKYRRLVGIGITTFGNWLQSTAIGYKHDEESWSQKLSSKEKDKEGN